MANIGAGTIMSGPSEERRRMAGAHSRLLRRGAFGAFWLAVFFVVLVISLILFRAKHLDPEWDPVYVAIQMMSANADAKWTDGHPWLI